MILLTLILTGCLIACLMLTGSVLHRVQPRWTCGLGGAASVAAGMVLATGAMQSLAWADAGDAPSPLDRPPAPAMAGDGPIASDAPPAPPAPPQPAAEPSADLPVPPAEPPRQTPPAEAEAPAADQPPVEAEPPAPAELSEAAESEAAQAEPPAPAEPPAQVESPFVPEPIAPARETPAAASELSSPLLSDLRMPPRPSWIYQEPWREDDAVFVAVSSDVQDNDVDARQALDAKLTAAVAEYARRQLGRENADYFLQFSPAEIRSLFVVEELIDQPSIGETVMSEAHALLRLDREAETQIARRWEEAVARNRLFQAGAAAALALLLLSMAFGYFRIDAATKGYYSGRLQMALAAAILALLAGSVILANQNDIWMWIL